MTGQISKTQAWILTTRPKTLPAAISPVLVGSALAYADGGFSLWPALAALVGSILLQIAVNVANDYFDNLSGFDTEDRQGPVRAAASGLLSPREMIAGLALLIFLVVLDGFYLITVAGWPIAIVGALALISMLAYSAGPLPLASNGLGDIFVFLFFGLAAVCGTYYVQTLTVTNWAILAAFPPGLLITAILVVNNTRDMETDQAVGKQTLAVLIGRKGSQIEFLTLIFASYFILPFFLIGPYSGWIFLAFLTLPLAARVIRSIINETGITLNKTLAETARLSLLFSLLFAVGLILS